MSLGLEYCILLCSLETVKKKPAAVNLNRVLIFVAYTMSLGLEYCILLCSLETVKTNLQQLT